LRVLHRVHHAFAGDVIHEQRDRRRQIDVGDIPMEADRRVPADLIRERLEGFGESLCAERRSVQVSDQRADAIRRLLLRCADLVELRAHVVDLSLLEELARDVHLDREPEEDLREIVVKVAGDLEAFVGTLLRHRVGECPEDLLAFLQFLVSFLERLRSEEHLPREEQWRQDGRKGPRGSRIEDSQGQSN
jgi:hypothetical protein